MRCFFQAGFLSFIAGLIISIAGCSKNKTPGGGNNAIAAQYPALISYAETGSQPIATTYEYNGKNELVKFGRAGILSTEVTSAGINVVNSGTASLYIVTTSYTFSLASGSPGSVNIYEGAPTQVSVDEFYKYADGSTQSKHVDNYYFECSPDGYKLKEIVNSGLGQNFNYTYDADKNLQQVDFVYLSGPRANAVYARLRITSLDKNPSPFVAVKGYKWAGYANGGDLVDYGFKFCHNNPIQIIHENFDASTNSFKMDEQDDFTYEYNEDGYPTRITLQKTYFGSSITTSSRVYTITYKK